MLTCIELSIGFLGAWFISGLIYGILKKKRKDKIPKGAIAIEKKISNEENIRPGNSLIHKAMIIGLSIPMLTLLFIVIMCLFRQWDNISPYFTFILPDWVNWLSMIGIWFIYFWGITVLVYNPNYTPIYKNIKGKYYLATGGPYKYIRHPYYTGNIFKIFLIFLVTGSWLVVFGIIAVVAIPFQAKKEEESLSELFGVNYRDYMARTGRFLPCLFKKRKKIN
ncbi:MAG: methyltransferase family protein [Candidatus Odinarchaeota archaeon]